ncbi:gliding motility protein GldL [Chishuiella changwenlii]|uniref:gliding motility protein GldL n=1 Tax=Chishuiella changwenlii TaxID=1434701 RepID=UPI002FDABAA9
MKIKHTLIILAIGIIIWIIGALMKITHLLNANMVLFISTIIEIIGVILFLYKIIKNKSLKDFLNS